LSASRPISRTLEAKLKPPIRTSSEAEGTRIAPPPAAAKTEEQEEEVDDIGDELDVDQLDSLWIEVCICDAGVIAFVNLEVCKLGKGLLCFC